METLHSGLMLNHFRIENQLGSGGMGSVYCGTDTTLNRQVAIKILDDRLQAVPENRERFQREARIIASLRHPNLMQIYFVGEDKGFQYFVMEYIRGVSLQKYLADKGGKLPLKEALRILIEVISALRKVHGNGIIHRDLKPANIMIDGDDGRAILVDFGLSKECEETAGLTSEGAILGTPDYMSPEQIEGGDLGPHTDIYALGVILYQMLSGVSPFRRKTTIQTLRAHCESAPPPLTAHDPGLPPSLAIIVNTMLAKTAEQRYKTVEELAAALYTVCKHPALTRMLGHDPAVTPDARTQIAPALAQNTPIRKVSVQMRNPGEIPTAPPGQPNKIIVAQSQQTPPHAVRQPMTRPQVVAVPITYGPQQSTIPPTLGRRGYLIAALAGAVALLLALFISGAFSRKKSPRFAQPPAPLQEPELIEIRPSTPLVAPASANPVPVPAQPATPAPQPVPPTGTVTTPAVSLPAPAAAAPQPATTVQPPALPMITFIPNGAAAASPGVNNPEVAIILRGGRRITGRIEELDGEKLRLRLNPGVVQDLPLNQIQEIISRESKRSENADATDSSREGQPRLPGLLLRRLERTQQPEPARPVQPAQPGGRP